MEWFVVDVELPESGIRGEEYVQSIFPSSAVEEVAARKTVRPLSVRAWNPEETRFVKLQNGGRIAAERL